jgi:hypothetical protein
MKCSSYFQNLSTSSASLFSLLQVGSQPFSSTSFDYLEFIRCLQCLLAPFAYIHFSGLPSSPTSFNATGVFAVAFGSTRLCCDNLVGAKIAYLEKKINSCLNMPRLYSALRCAALI